MLSDETRGRAMTTADSPRRASAKAVAQPAVPPPKMTTSFIYCAPSPIPGAKSGGAAMTQAGAAATESLAPFNFIIAVPGPSDTSLCQLSLFANVWSGFQSGEFERPKAANTSR